MDEIFNHRHENERLTRALKKLIDERGVKYSFVAHASGIEYQRLIRLLHGRAVLSAVEFVAICRLFEFEHAGMFKEAK